MSAVDRAFERLCEVLEAPPPEDDRPIDDNEACTRAHLIDPILLEVLGWPRGSITVEQPAGGGRCDYLVRDADGVCWLVIEAKKRDAPLLAPRMGPPRAETLKLTGPVLRSATWGIIDEQMSAYLGRYMPAYGVVTNGEQWILFLARLRPPAVDLAEAQALVFRSFGALRADFELFYEALAAPRISSRLLQRRLSPEQWAGVVPCTSPARVVSRDEERALDHQERGDFYKDLQRAMDIAFGPLQRDPDALSQCFVNSPHSRRADSRLTRLAAELEAVLQPAAEYPEAVRDEVGAVSEVVAADLDGLSGCGYLARLVGEPSSGKSVFLQRFFRQTLAAEGLADRVLLPWIDCEQVPSPFTAEHATRAALAQARRGLFGDEGPTREHLLQVYSSEWTQWRRLREDGEAEFIEDRLRAEEDHPEEALTRHLDFAVRNRRRLPCVVVDNVDHLDVAGPAAAWATALHLRGFALTTLAIDDGTLWRLRRDGKDQLFNHAPEQFWLPRPPVRQVLERRRDYLRDVLTRQATRSTPARTRLGRHRQYEWRVDADGLVRVVSAALLDDAQVAGWIGRLCNYDIGMILDHCKRVVLSPHVKAEELLISQAAGRTIRRRSVLRALIAPRSHQYRPRAIGLVSNIFGFWHQDSWAPLLPARILALLAAREDREKERNERFPGFFVLGELQRLLGAELLVPEEVSWACLLRLETAGLVEPYEPSRSLAPDAPVKLTPRGRLHLQWARDERTYVRLMAEVDPLVDRNVRDALRAHWDAFLQSLASGGGGARTAETDLASGYVRHVLVQADRVSPVSDADALQPVREYQSELRAAWQSQS